MSSIPSAIQGEKTSHPLTLEELYKDFGATMLYVAKNILQDQSLAESAVLKAFHRINENLQKFMLKTCKETRFLTVIIVKSICYDILQQDNKNIVPIEEIENIYEEEDGLLDIEISNKTYDTVFSCILTLDDKFKDILRLKLYYAYTDKEIGELLGITPDNVAMRFLRAKEVLIEEMQKGANENAER